MTTPAIVEKQQVDIELGGGMDESSPEEAIDWLKKLVVADNVVSDGKSYKTRPGARRIAETQDDFEGNGIITPICRMGALDGGIGVVANDGQLYHLNESAVTAGTDCLQPKGKLPELGVRSRTVASVASGQGLLGVARTTKYDAICYLAPAPGQDPTSPERCYLSIIDRKSGNVVRTYWTDSNSYFGALVSVDNRYLHWYTTDGHAPGSGRPRVVTLDTHGLSSPSGIIVDAFWTNLAVHPGSGFSYGGCRLVGVVSVSGKSVYAIRNPGGDVLVGGVPNLSSISAGVAVTGFDDCTGIDTDGTNFFLVGIGPSPAAPTLVSLDFDLADIGGGDSITITGTNLTGATLCMVGGTSATITANTATTLTFTMPAKAAGSYNIQVTTPSGVSGVIPIEAWSPLQVTGVDSYFDSRKNVTLSGSNVTAWLEQSRSASYTGPGGNQPTKVNSVFGTKPAIRFVQQQWVSAARRTLTSGYSQLWVGKWTSSDSTSAHASDPPLTVVGDDHSSTLGSVGASAGNLAMVHYNGSYTPYSRGSGLNDGQTRLCGWTHETSTGALKAYVGQTQQGATATESTFASGHGYTSVGVGGSGTSVDGFIGDLGAVIVVSGVISSGDLTKLYKWAKSSFGAI